MKSEGEAISEIATGFALAMTKTPFSDNLEVISLEELRPSKTPLIITPIEQHLG